MKMNKNKIKKMEYCNCNNKIYLKNTFQIKKINSANQKNIKRKKLIIIIPKFQNLAKYLQQMHYFLNLKNLIFKTIF